MKNEKIENKENKQKKQLPSKQKKTDVKKYTLKKLPGLFKKTYTEKKLNKKIYSKIYISSDKELVQSLFERGSNKKRPDDYAVSETKLFSKSELKQLKVIAKDIKKNKGGVKFLPLIAVVVSIAAFVIVISVFKNPLAKKALKSTCEAVFAAKTDIQSVDIQFFGASITVNKIAIGNKNSVMKNLFEAEKIELDFNLTQLLRGKFDAENLEASGIAFNTDRTTSCELPAKVKKQKKQEKKDDSAFAKALKAKSSKAIDDLKLEVEAMFGGSDIDSIVANIEDQLKTPETSERVQKEVVKITEKWQKKPEELKNQVVEFSDSVKDLQTLDVSKIKDVNQLKETLDKVNNALEKSNTMGKSISAVSDDIKKDSKTVSSLSKELTDSINSDTALAKNAVNTVTDTVKNANQIFTNALDIVGYDMIGKYYPYAKRLVSYAATIKAQSANKAKADSGKKQKPAKVKKSGKRRQEGTTLWFKRQNPSFLIERMYFSGDSNGAKFSAEARELTNDQDVREKPSTLKGSFIQSGISHGFDFVLDARSASKAPLLQLEYTGKGFGVNVDGESIAVNAGVPSIGGKANINLSGSAGSDSFSAKGTVSVTPCNLTSSGFGNEFIDKYYIQALESVKNLSLGYSIDYTQASGLDLALTGNYASVFANAFTTVAYSMGNDAKDEILARVNEQINASSKDAMDKIKEFTGVELDVNSQISSFDSIKAQLESKQKELEKRIKDNATDAAKNAVNSAASGLIKGLKK